MKFSLIAGSIFSVAILCSGCGGTTIKPDSGDKKTNNAGTAIETRKPLPEPVWVTDESKEYPRMQYLTVRATAATATAADKLAMAKLMQRFVINLNDYDMSVEQAKLSANYEINQTHLPEDQPTAASPQIDRILKNIKIADRWHDIANNTYHALAVAPRNISKGYLRKQIETLDKNTTTYIEEARANADPLTRAGLMGKAWRSQQIRTSLQKSMRVADLTGRGMKPELDVEAIKQEFDKLTGELHILAAGLDEDPNRNEMAIILNAGIKAAKLKPADEKTANYVLRGILESSIIGERKGWAVGQGKIKLVLTDKSSGKVRGSRQWEFEAQGLNEDAAYRRINEKAEYMIKRDLRNLIIDISMQQAY